jgi:hypothetical protein
MAKKFFVLVIITSCVFIWAQNAVEIPKISKATKSTPVTIIHGDRFANDVKITDDHVPHFSPEVDVNPQLPDNAFCAFEAVYTGYPAIMIYETTDGGFTWSPFGGIYNPGGNWLALGSITVTLNRVCICYTDEGTERVETYSKPKTGGSGDFYQFPQNPAYHCRMSKKWGGNDLLDIVFIYEYGSGGHEECMIYCNSANGGVSWTNEYSFALDEGHMCPDVYHYPFSNNVYIGCYSWALDALKFAKSTDGGGSFTTQFFPNTYLSFYPKIARSSTYIVILFGDNQPRCVWSSNEGASWNQFALPLGGVGMDRFSICYGNLKFRAAACDGGAIKHKTASTPTEFTSSWLAINDAGSGYNPGLCHIAGNAALVVWFDTREYDNKIFCDNESWETGVEEDKLITGLPKIYKLSQNYPNPIVSKTMIKYSLSKKANVELKIYDVSGREVAVLVNETQQAGHYQVNWDINDLPQTQLPNGIYFYQLKTEDFTETRKMTILR